MSVFGRGPQVLWFHCARVNYREGRREGKRAGGSEQALDESCTRPAKGSRTGLLTSVTAVFL